MIDWNARYAKGYDVLVEHTEAKTWRSMDKVPRLDGRGCSRLCVMRVKYRSNPVGMDTPEHTEVAFFHAQSGPYGNWFHVGEVVSRYIVWPDGWKPCTKPDMRWIELVEAARKQIESGEDP